MNEVKLLNRVDTKFVFKTSKLDILLELLKDEYDVLEIKNEIATSYESLYFDSKDFFAFKQHQRGKGERFKVRFRNYVSSKLCFLEVKRKHKGRTVKSRIKVNGFENKLSNESLSFISSQIDVSNIALEAVIQINYNRITLVNKNRSERITLDLDLTLKHNGVEKILNQIVIAELKQQKINRTSTFYQTVKKLQIRNVSISKYCTGIILLNKNLNYNSFKEKLLYINKLTNGDIIRSIAA